MPPLRVTRLTAIALLAASFLTPTASSAQIRKCEDKWHTFVRGKSSGAEVLLQLNCAAEQKRVVVTTRKRNGDKDIRIENFAGEALIGTNTIIVAKSRLNGSISVYRMGVKPGDSSEELFLWKYRVDKDRTPERVLQNTDPLGDKYRKVGSIRQRRGEVVVAARTVGVKEYPAVFFLKYSNRGEAMVYRTEVGDAVPMRRVPGAPTLDEEQPQTLQEGTSRWIPRH